MDGRLVIQQLLLHWKDVTVHANVDISHKYFEKCFAFFPPLFHLRFPLACFCSFGLLQAAVIFACLHCRVYLPSPQVRHKYLLESAIFAHRSRAWPPGLETEI